MRQVSGIIRIIVIAALMAGMVTPASAQTDYPNRPIRIVVPVPPGGFADALPRLVADQLKSYWHQPVLIENRPGAALNIGAEAVAKAAPDGYTLLATPAGPLVTNWFLFRKLSFDPDAFVPITVLAKGPFLLLARRNLPVSSLSDLIAYAKANPGKLTFASSGRGSPPHLAMELFQSKAGIRLLHVPYKGLSPALADLIGGHVDLMFHDLPSALPQFKAGTLKVLGVGGAARIPQLPNLPAIAEKLPGFSAGYWYAVVAPPKTPPAVADLLSKAMARALQAPTIASRLHAFSIAAVGSTPAETAAFFKAEIKRWRGVATAAGVGEKRARKQ